MPSLRELQMNVMAALLAERATPAPAPSGDKAPPWLRVHRSNVRGNFADALRASFPAIARLVGDEYFQRTAAAFQQRQPSRSGDLSHAGEHFPAYLASLHGHDAFGYLADIARLEWLIQETLRAAGHAPLDVELLRGVAPANYAALRCRLHPALRLFESRYPALSIWEANVASDALPPIIDLGGGGDRVAVTRHRMQLRFLPLSEGEYRFLASLQRGESVGAAVAEGQADVSFDATAALHRCVAAEAVVAFVPPQALHEP